MEIKENDDFISDMVLENRKRLLLATRLITCIMFICSTVQQLCLLIFQFIFVCKTFLKFCYFFGSGDGTLSAFDIRKHKMKQQSELFDSEMLSLAIVKVSIFRLCLHITFVKLRLFLTFSILGDSYHKQAGQHYISS